MSTETLQHTDSDEQIEQPNYAVELLPDVSYDSHFGGRAEVFEAIPANNDIAIDDEPDVYYAHGSLSLGADRATVKELAEQGRRAFTIDYVGPRMPDSRFIIGGVAVGGVMDVSKKEMKKAQPAGLDMIVPKQQMREAATLLGIIAERDRGPVDIIAQSLKGAESIIAAWIDSHPDNPEPRRINNVVLAFPGGIIGKQKDILKGVIGQIKMRREQKPDPSNDFSVGTPIHKAMAKQAMGSGFKEDGAAVNYGMLARMIHQIKERPNGPKITIFAGELDGIFLPDRLIAALVDPEDAEIVVVPGGHGIGGRKDVLAMMDKQLKMSRID